MPPMMDAKQKSSERERMDNLEQLKELKRLQVESERRKGFVLLDRRR
jgi:hypothetical protein